LLLVPVAGGKVIANGNVHIEGALSVASPDARLPALQASVDRLSGLIATITANITVQQATLNSLAGSVASMSAKLDATLALLAPVLDECRSSPCVQAVRCVDGLGSFVCVCSVGFTGARCDTLIV
jgi:hypothetical protein